MQNEKIQKQIRKMEHFRDNLRVEVMLLEQKMAKLVYENQRFAEKGIYGRNEVKIARCRQKKMVLEHKYETVENMLKLEYMRRA